MLTVSWNCPLRWNTGYVYSPLQSCSSFPHLPPLSSPPSLPFRLFNPASKALLLPSYLSPLSVCSFHSLLQSLAPMGADPPRIPPSTFSLSRKPRERKWHNKKPRALCSRSHCLGTCPLLKTDNLFTLNGKQDLHFLRMNFPNFNNFFYEYVVKTAQISSIYRQ